MNISVWRRPPAFDSYRVSQLLCLNETLRRECTRGLLQTRRSSIITHTRTNAPTHKHTPTRLAQRLSRNIAHTRAACPESVPTVSHTTSSFVCCGKNSRVCCLTVYQQSGAQFQPNPSPPPHTAHPEQWQKLVISRAAHRRRRRSKRDRCCAVY